MSGSCSRLGETLDLELKGIKWLPKLFLLITLYVLLYTNNLS
jgi:hypothetical protein